MKTFAPTIGGGVGAGAGALVGNPIGGAIIGGSLGAGAGQLIHEIDRNEDAKATVKLLTEGDVNALMTRKLDDHASGIAGFMDSLKKWLFVTAIGLGLYLMVPIFVAKRTAQTCSKTEAQRHQSRAPFPVKK